MNATQVGRALERSRRRAGLTQAELAVRMGTGQPSISRAESGRIQPSIDFIDRFARGTGQPVELRFDPRLPSRGRRGRRRRVREALGDFEFNPWDRSPTDAEARSLIADGLSRERFESSRAARSSRR